MLLGARQFFERRGSPTPPLPYDAEVEYLESTGTQYIDTGVIIDDDRYLIDCEFAATVRNQSAWARFFGSYVSEAARSTRLINYDATDWRVYAGFRRASSAQSPVGIGYPQLQSRLRYAMSAGRLLVTQNGDLLVEAVLQSPSGYPEDTSTIKIFGAKMRLWRFNILLDSTEVRDFIPVRVGSGSSAVGYLYDRANPTGGPLGNGLYGNAAGTDDFVIGPDKS